jgi:hypothetical protein
MHTITVLPCTTLHYTTYSRHTAYCTHLLVDVSLLLQLLLRLEGLQVLLLLDRRLRQLVQLIAKCLQAEKAEAFTEKSKSISNKNTLRLLILELLSGR